MVRWWGAAGSQWLEIITLIAATHLEQSNHLPNQKQGTVGKYNLTVNLLDSSQDPLEKLCIFLKGPQQSSSQLDY